MKSLLQKHTKQFFCNKDTFLPCINFSILYKVFCSEYALNYILVRGLNNVVQNGRVVGPMVRELEHAEVESSGYINLQQ